MKRILLLILSTQLLVSAPSDAVYRAIKRANRRANSKIIRNTATETDARQGLAAQPTNGDQERYADKRGNYGKGLQQDDNGLVNIPAYNSLTLATSSWNSADFDKIIMGTSPIQNRLHSPQAGLDFNIFGADSAIHSIPAPPAVASAEKAGEMVEVYWMALLRDVNFDVYSTDPIAAQAITDLNNLSDFKGKPVTAQTLFRLSFTGIQTGPYISQFLYQSVPFSDTLFAQQYNVPTASSTNNFMSTVSEWSLIQKGTTPTRSITFNTNLYMRNGRDIGNFVHKDPPQLPYFYALCILLSYGSAAIDQNNPYIGNPTQEQFADFFKPQFAGLMCYTADVALRAAWFQKWMVHRTIRPEMYAFLVNQQITGAFDYGLNSDVINSQAVQSIFTSNAANATNAGVGTYLLPQAFPEGCPLHPTYPAGHATVAGACVTMLKAFFNEDFVITSPVVPNAGGTALVAYVGDALTIGGELNKLGANISVGRNIAGVHYRSDAVESMLLGEKVAISILEDWALTMNIPFKGFSLTKFDGTKIIVGAKRNINLLG